MLKGISPIIPPELLKTIAEMGHGDELVLADGNFPGTSIGKTCIRCDGHGCAEVMEALMTLFPLDDFVPAPLAVMAVPDGMFEGNKAPIWEKFRAAADKDLPTAQFDMMEHDAFMDRARNAYAVVQTGETALYGNIIIRKGVVRL
ncbi:MAG: RbsD/FucU domain-containing protein [Clostridia bacterium]|nr:RbsD/FucU domain-containing protein [Clostridia bacterium]